MNRVLQRGGKLLHDQVEQCGGAVALHKPAVDAGVQGELGAVVDVEAQVAAALAPVV